MKCVEVYEGLYHQEPFDVAFCPYRISPLGAHIDHQYGKINGLAIDKGIHELIPTSQSMKPYKIAIFFSGLERSLKNSKYNLRQDECKAAAYALMGYAGMDYGTFADTRLRDVPYEVFEAYKDHLPELWRRRAEHYYSEFARAEKGAELWREGDLEGYGQLVFESGKSSIYSYECGCDELKKLYEIMWNTDGIYGGRFSGAGFKGCCMALVDPEKIEDIKAKVTEEYLKAFPELEGKYSAYLCESADGVEHLVYASSSSVYGSNKKVPYATEDKVDNPVSLYAATKKSNELMAHAYSKLYNIPSTGLRFFTVYGPAGRPDMAYFGFTNKLRTGDTIQIFNYGNCKRDFTYVDDIVEGVKRVMQAAPEKKNGEDGLPIPPYAVYNIGNSHPENLLEFVDILQQELISAGVLPEDYDFDAHKKLVPMQPGDVPVTYADTTALEEDFGFKPQTSLREGLRKFAQWYAEFYK